MMFDTPDQALRASHATRERLESIPAMDPVAQEGTRFARECSRCGSQPYHLRHTRDGSPFATCRHCGKDRHREDVFVLRMRGSTGGDRSAPFVKLADLERVIVRARSDDPGRFSAYMTVILSGLSMERILEFCNSKKWGPGCEGGFTPWTLRRAVRDGRSSLAWQLHRVGMLASDLERWTESERWGNQVPRATQ